MVSFMDVYEHLAALDYPRAVPAHSLASPSTGTAVPASTVAATAAVTPPARLPVARGTGGDATVVRQRLHGRTASTASGSGGGTAPVPANAVKA